jgi:hypothetical protein
MLELCLAVLVGTVVGPEHDMAMLTVSSTCKVCVYSLVYTILVLI